MKRWSLASLLNGCMSAVWWSVISLIHSAHYQFAAFAYVCRIFSFVCADFQSLAGHLGSYEPHVQPMRHRYKKKEKRFLVLNYLPLKKEFLYHQTVLLLLSLFSGLLHQHTACSHFGAACLNHRSSKINGKGICTKWWVSEMWVFSCCSTHTNTHKHSKPPYVRWGRWKTWLTMAAAH